MVKDTTNDVIAYLFADDNNAYVGAASNHPVIIKQNNGTAATIDTNKNATFVGDVADSKGDLRIIPRNAQSSTYTLVASDSGKCVRNTTGGWIIPANVFSTIGQTVTLLNASSSDQTINASALAFFYNTADGANIQGNTITLGPRAMATIWFEGTDTGFVQASNMTVS